MATEKLELLVLRTLMLAPLHGYGISQRIEQVSGGVFKVTLGALYPASSVWSVTAWSKANGRPPKTNVAPAITH